MIEYFLGIDVGYSQIRRSTGLCLLYADAGVLWWECLNTGSRVEVRVRDLRAWAAQNVDGRRSKA